jgi:hypothetical protein
MKDIFSGYYRPSEEELQFLWDNCLFVFDTNVLLNFYRYSKETYIEFMDILDIISDRVWIPHQVALEYHKNRLSVIYKQKTAYKDLEDKLQSFKNKIDNELRQYLRHSLININPYLVKMTSFFNSIIDELNIQEKDHPDLFTNDTINDKITSIFDKRVGDKYSDERLEEIYREGKKRYKLKIPPGYEDENKGKNEEKYGDLVLWFQLLDKAKELNKPIILVCDDSKNDWWWEYKGLTFGPHPQLREEFVSFCSVPFYMYKSDQFMELSRFYLKQSVDQKAINEIREIRKADVIDIFIKKKYQFNEDSYNDIERSYNLYMDEIATDEKDEIYDEKEIERSYNLYILENEREAIYEELRYVEKELKNLYKNAETSSEGKDYQIIHEKIYNMQRKHSNLTNDLNRVEKKIRTI